MNNDGEMPGRRFTLKGWHLALVILLVLVGLIGLHFVRRHGENERRIAALRAAGYPTTSAELAEYTRLPAGVQNAADVYMQALDAFASPVDGPNVPLLGRGKLPDRGAPLPEPMARAVADCVADNQPCLALLHEAAGIEDCRYDWDYRQPMPEALAQGWRHGALLLKLATIHHACRGDNEAALVCVRDGLRLSDSLRREPTLISYLIRVAGVGAALGGLEYSLNLTTFTDRQLQETGEALVRTGGTLDFTRVLVTERCFMIEGCRNPLLLGSSGRSTPVRMVPGMRGTWLADTLNYMEAHIEACQRPSVERLKRFREIRAKMEQLSFLHLMTKITAPALTRVAELDLRARAHLELAKTALAIERYRLVGGKVPERLEELVPQYLKEVPSDPFDGNPIRYRRTEPGYCLYSVSDDGQDNGGKEKADVPVDAPYDWCFIVKR